MPPASAPPVLVLDVVGLTPALLAHAPRLSALAREGFLTTLEPPLPAVTCSAQATMLTGLSPREHGIVGNGWYFRDLSEVLFWRQSNALVHGEKVWETARRLRPGLKVAKLFWWYNMYSSADLAVTPRPHYLADGRKFPGIYTQPAQLEAWLEADLGAFPLFQFWGPGAGVASTDWIARCARAVFEKERPDLSLVYLPHLDYDLQRFGPAHPRALAAVAEVDAIAGALAEEARAQGARVIVVSEYGIDPVSRPVHLNRALREAGFLAIRDSPWVREQLDAGASRAFAVADHQIAHIYVRDPADLQAVRALVEKQPGVERVLDEAGKKAAGLDHPRAGELVAIAAPDSWFTYYYWLDDRRAPDYARTVEIHKKPGYDPVELFLAPGRTTKLRAAFRLAQKKTGFRYVMDVVPLDATLVRGSHGRLPSIPERGPLLFSPEKALGAGIGERASMAVVRDVILRALGADR